MKISSDHFKKLREIVQLALDEDIGKGDITSLASLEPVSVVGTVIAKSSGILSGLSPALLAFEIVDSANKIRALKNDGEFFEAGDVILEISGFNLTVLIAERTALNFMGRLSGVATLTHKFIKELEGTNCKLLDTRKTTPGLRFLEKQAVKDGGGLNHRFGLYDMILIKENHITSAGSIKQAIENAHQYMTTSDFRLQFDKPADQILIEVEITNEKQLKEALDSNVDRILLDNLPPKELSKLVNIAQRINPSVKLEASGNITLKNAHQVASSGVDFISVGAITHSAPTSDFSLIINE